MVDYVPMKVAEWKADRAKKQFNKASKLHGGDVTTWRDEDKIWKLWDKMQERELKLNTWQVRHCN